MKKKIQKPFDVEAAKRGAVVETKGGRSVRIVCYNRAGTDYPIVALINYQIGNESCESYNAYTTKGELVKEETNEEDLIIIEEVDCPKFKVGDWIFAKNNGKRTWLIIAVTPDCYELQDIQGSETSIAQITIDNYYRLWTLDDAKSGDVLVGENSKRPFIFKGCIDEAHPGYPTAYCGINCSDEFVSDTSQSWWTDSSVRPATYKERQQLFNRLEEEGYKWDLDSLTLSKIQKRWRDKEDAEVNGYYIYSDSHIVKHSGYNSIINHNLFATKKQAKSALAMAYISQIMANDERFGGVVTDEEWINKSWTTIIKIDNKLTISNRFGYTFLAFHTMEQANLFLQENEDLVKAYYMMD